MAQGRHALDTYVGCSCCSLSCAAACRTGVRRCLLFLPAAYILRLSRLHILTACRHSHRIFPLLIAAGDVMSFCVTFRNDGGGHP
jgi:hypothetical protein